MVEHYASPAYTRWLETRPDALQLRLRSEHGDQGFPGTLDVALDVTLRDDDALVIEERATTDRPTVVSLAFHPYFNLKDGGASSALDHRLEIAADSYTPVDAELIPRGPLAPVAGTRFDFRRARPVSTGDYDHNFVLNGRSPAVTLVDPESGRAMRITTTKPGLQLYSGNARGLCLEPQSFPDSPNRSDFPSTVLRPGTEYRHVTVYAFSSGVER